MDYIKCTKCKRLHMLESTTNYKTCYLCRLSHKSNNLMVDSDATPAELRENNLIMNEIETIKTNYKAYGIIRKPLIINTLYNVNY